MPFRVRDPRSSSATPSAAVAVATSHSTPSPACINRAARFTTRPSIEYSRRPCAPMGPQIASPVAIPTSMRTPAARSSAPMRRAASRARRGSSSWASGGNPIAASTVRPLSSTPSLSMAPSYRYSTRWRVQSPVWMRCRPSGGSPGRGERRQNSTVTGRSSLSHCSPQSRRRRSSARGRNGRIRSSPGCGWPEMTRGAQGGARVSWTSEWPALPTGTIEAWSARCFAAEAARMTRPAPPRLWATPLSRGGSPRTRSSLRPSTPPTTPVSMSPAARPQDSASCWVSRPLTRRRQL